MIIHAMSHPLHGVAPLPHLGIIRVQGRAKGTFTARDFPEIGPLKAFRLMRHMQQAGEIELVEEGKRGRWGYPAKYRFTE